MTKLQWNNPGERTFETGVSHGVLYIEGQPGVAWNGLTGVQQRPSGGSVTPYYLDGRRYLNHAVSDEFEADVSAYTYPEEFEQCEGVEEVQYGLFATAQKKKNFSLAYRSLVGNDLEGEDHAYKIHLIYDATAEAADKDHESISDILDPFEFTWRIQTRPSVFVGFSHTAYFVIDSRKTPESLLTLIESILYGSASTDPRIPSADELLYLFGVHDSDVIDAGYLVEEYFLEIDAGHISEAQTETIDGGGA